MEKELFVPVSLPSKCLTYEGVDPDSIKIRAFKGREEELLAELNLSNLPKKLLTIIENVVQGIEVKKLTSGDARFIMMWEAINSYSSEFLFPFVSACNQEPY